MFSQHDYGAPIVSKEEQGVVRLVSFVSVSWFDNNGCSPCQYLATGGSCSVARVAAEGEREQIAQHKRMKAQTNIKKTLPRLLFYILLHMYSPGIQNRRLQPQPKPQLAKAQPKRTMI